MLASTGAVTLDTNTLTVTTCASSTPATPATPASGGGSVFISTDSEGTINVVKIVINDSGRSKTIADFPLFVNGTPVVSGITNTFSASADAYTVSEIVDSNYTQTFSGDCDVNGQLNLMPGDNKFCIITNNDIDVPVKVLSVPPLIDVVKTPSPLALPLGPGLVNYTYTVSNIGTVPVTDMTMVGDSCSPVTYVSGDINNDSRLDTSETWTYACVTNLTQTTTNIATASGEANGLSVKDIAIATVVVAFPGLPQTGAINNCWFIAIMVGVIILSSVLFIVIRKKRQA